MKIYKGFLLAIAFATFTFTDLSAQNKPNIIVVFTDDQGYADLSIQGYLKDIKTPNIDELAKTGVRFTNGYATSAQCSPSRAGLITGKYQERFDFDHIPDGPLPLTELTIANHLKPAGYISGQVGKWHLEPNALTARWLKEILPNAKPNAEGRYRIPAELIPKYMPGARGFDDFFTGYEQTYFANFDLNDKKLNPTGQNVNVEGYRLDIQTQAALKFIQNNKETPFFLYLNYYGPHVPLVATEKYLNRFPGDMPERRRHALAMISAIDDGVGQITQLLKKENLFENTMIIYCSDNGAPLGINKEDIDVKNPIGKWDGSLNDPLLGEKGMLTEGGIKVPFIVSFPKMHYTGVSDVPISTLDILPTALNLAGLKPFKDADGISFLPLLKGKASAKELNRALFWRFWRQTAVQQNHYKLIKTKGLKPFLFNLKTDPSEQNNLYDFHPEIAAKLEQQLNDWTKQLKPIGYPKGDMNDQEVGWYHYYLNTDAKHQRSQ